MREIDISMFLVVKQSLAGEHVAAGKEDAIAAAALHTVNFGGCDTDDPPGELREGCQISSGIH
jgi:hypothetical protein